MKLTLCIKGQRSKSFLIEYANCTNCLDVKKFVSKDENLVSDSRNQMRYIQPLINYLQLESSQKQQGTIPNWLGNFSLNNWEKARNLHLQTEYNLGFEGTLLFTTNLSIFSFQIAPGTALPHSSYLFCDFTILMVSSTRNVKTSQNQNLTDQAGKQQN